jgi:hypothetical protein
VLRRELARRFTANQPTLNRYLSQPLGEAVAAGLPIEQLFTLTHEVTGSAPPEEGEDGQGQARPSP